MAKKRAGGHIVLGVTGSIAAYKAGDIVRRLQDVGHTVSVVMTKEAESFIAPLTLETLSGNKVARDMFKGVADWRSDHIHLAEQADLLLIAPATAHILAKLANGLADDLICSTALASLAPKLIAPAMNSNMYVHPITQANIKRLKEIGYRFIDSIEGRMACGTTGPGHLADVMTIVEAVNAILK